MAIQQVIEKNNQQKFGKVYLMVFLLVTMKTGNDLQLVIKGKRTVRVENQH